MSDLRRGCIGSTIVLLLALATAKPTDFPPLGVPLFLMLWMAMGFVITVAICGKSS